MRATKLQHKPLKAQGLWIKDVYRQGHAATTRQAPTNCKFLNADGAVAALSTQVHNDV